MTQTVASQLDALGFKYESSSNEHVIYTNYGPCFNERVLVVLNVDTGEVSLTREYDDITEKTPLVVRWSQWDDTVALVLERWCA